MTSILVFDIETIPDVVGIRKLRDLSPEISDEEVAQIAFHARQEKTGSEFLPHHLQRIAAISCVFRRTTRDGQALLRIGSLGVAESSNDSHHEASEATLIRKFFELIEKHTPQLVSWNGGGFDLPVLHYRAMIHGIEAARYWEMGESTAHDAREFKWNNYINRYHSRHLDLMDVLAMYQPRANAPLDELAKLCGFPGKMGMDGAQVWSAYQEGRLAEIRQYCETDVVNTYLLYCRFQLMRGGFSLQEYDNEVRLVKDQLSSETGPQWPAYLDAFSAADLPA